MDYKKSKAPTNTVTHNLMDLAEETGNLYESLVIISKRANQISAQMKEDLNKKLKEFASSNDNLKRLSRTVSRLKFHVITNVFPNPHSLLQTSSFAVRFTSKTPTKIVTNSSAKTKQ